MSDLMRKLAAPYPTSSLSFAYRSAPKNRQLPLRALYTLHQKWRETSAYEEQHQAIITLNWWHYELEKAKLGEIHHPALSALEPWLRDDASYTGLQGLLHGHMHWHHLTRVETKEQLLPIIDAIAGSYITIWLFMIEQANLKDFAQAAARALWWIDQTRHLGHNLTTSRLWLPIDWLKELNTPAHILLRNNTSINERIQSGLDISRKLITIAQQALSEYQKHYIQLTKNQQKAVKSIHALLQQRTLLLHEISLHPQEIWRGLVTISPHRKWWASIRA